MCLNTIKQNYKEICAYVLKEARSTNPKVRLHMLFAISHLSRHSENRKKFAEKFENELDESFSHLVGTQVCEFGMKKDHLEKAGRLCQTWKKERIFSTLALDSFSEIVKTSMENERLPCECNHCSALTIDKVLGGYGKRDILKVDEAELDMLNEHARKNSERRASCSLVNTPASTSTTPCSQATPTSGGSGSATNTTEEPRKIISIYQECLDQALSDFPLDRDPIQFEAEDEEEAKKKNDRSEGAPFEGHHQQQQGVSTPQAQAGGGGFNPSMSGVDLCARCTYPFPSPLAAEEISELGLGITSFLRRYAPWMGKHDVEGIRLCGDGLQFKSKKREDGQRVYYYSTDVRLRIANSHQYDMMTSLCDKPNIKVELRYCGGIHLGNPGGSSIYEIEFQEARVVMHETEKGERGGTRHQQHHQQQQQRQVHYREREGDGWLRMDSNGERSRDRSERRRSSSDHDRHRHRSRHSSHSGQKHKRSSSWGGGVSKHKGKPIRNHSREEYRSYRR